MATPTRAALANLEQADVVVLGDGECHEAAWRAMNDGPDGIAERIRWRYYHGAVLLGVGSGAMLLGKHGHARKPPPPPPAAPPGETTGGGGGALCTYKAFEIVPAVIGVDEELVHETVEQLGYGALGFVLPLRGGFLFNTDGTFEAAHGLVTELRLSFKQGAAAAAAAAANPIVYRGLILFCTHCFLG